MEPSAPALPARPRESIAMSPDLLFWLMLILKMAVTAAFVIIATITAERSGPLIGGLIATLPISAGPAYVFLSLDHSVQFVADSALMSFATNPAIALYALIYAWLAQRHGLALSLGGAVAGWLVMALMLQSTTWTLAGVLLLHVAVFPVCLLLARPLRDVPIPRLRVYWYDTLLRAAAVAALVASVVGLSFSIGPHSTGVLAVFPIVLTSIIIILHRRVGGRATAAVMANSVLGLIGFGAALVVLHLTVVPLGPVLALPLAFAAAVGWSLLVLGVGRLRRRV